MPTKLGFDPDKYLEEQSKYILERFPLGQRLYIEFGGKLVHDKHAKRVLPGFDENAKIKILSKLKDNLEVIICIYSGDIERNKTRQDFGITYDAEVFKLIDDFRKYELSVNSVVITRYTPHPATDAFMTKLQRRGIKVYTHKYTAGYPTDVDKIVSDEGYGANPYIVATKPIVAVTGPGPGSGKLATCLSQLYHEDKMGKKAAYSKFETFPVWNVPLKHPLNAAYEAATIDLNDVNMIDSYHLEAHGVMAVNYNRDLETFPVIKRIIEKITGEESIYKSPTDMGVNRVGFSIIDDDVVREASLQEIIRRYLISKCEYKTGKISEESLKKSKLLMDDYNLKEEDRVVVGPARQKAAEINSANDMEQHTAVMALELPDGKIVTGKNSSVMDAASACILNAIKELAGLADELHLISPVVLEPIQYLKCSVRRKDNAAMDLGETLIALTICAATNPTAQVALEKLSLLRDCKAHSTMILTKNAEMSILDLGIDCTCDPNFQSNNLFYI
ncbi:MAG: DUF1846 domain-containing protein [Firmicutes bacterium]|nr:DUF1846 domain-containing protein [Bacillota bacterium]